MKIFFYTSLIFFFLSTLTQGEVIYVPAEYSTIQEALNACSPGDTVMVTAGTYPENIVWPSTENLYLVSESGAATTIINGSTISHPDSGSIIYFFNVNNAIVDGFTIKNGSGTVDAVWGRLGGGIFCKESSPQIINNIIEINNADYGAGISCLSNASPLIDSNTIKNNIAVNNGGGIDIYLNSNPQILNNLIENNYATFGGGIICGNFSSPRIEGNTVTGNSVGTSGGGILIFDNSAAIVINNTITLNQASEYYGAGIRCGVNNMIPIIRGCTIEDNIGVGITCRNSSPIIDSCSIVGNEFEGVLCYEQATPEIHYCFIYDNGLYGVLNGDSTVMVNAENNWWGDASGPSGAGPGTGDSVSKYVDYDPWLTIVSMESKDTEMIADDFRLFQNYPNPFNPTTRIKFIIKEFSFVKMNLYDVIGNEVNTLIDDELLPGSYEFVFNAVGLPSGVYFYVLETSDFREVKKMVLLK